MGSRAERGGISRRCAAHREHAVSTPLATSERLESITTARAGATQLTIGSSFFFFDEINHASRVDSDAQRHRGRSRPLRHRGEGTLSLSRELVGTLAQELRCLPKVSTVSKQEAIRMLASDIEALKAQGYTYREILLLLQERGLEIKSVETLKNYLHRAKRRTKKPSTAPAPTHRTVRVECRPLPQATAVSCPSGPEVALQTRQAATPTTGTAPPPAS